MLHKTDHDGPYYFTQPGEERVIYANYSDKAWQFESGSPKKTMEVRAQIDTEAYFDFQFEVEIQSQGFSQKSTFDRPSRMLAISDVEGNFIALYSWLLANGAIDKEANWIFGDGHLVIVGDIMDRGNQVTQLLWLIYKIHYQAEKAGGKVHAMIGNHDAMNFHMDLRYIHDKYLSLARHISGKQDKIEAYKHLWNEKNLLYQWVRNWPSILSIGNLLFVHAGISEQIVDYNLSISEINRISRENIHKDLYGKKDGDASANLIAGRMGPWWYRGMVEDYSNRYKKITSAALDRILGHFDASKVIVGHTVQDDIACGFDNRVVMIDVLHGWEMNSGTTRGILIENETIYRLDDRGIQSPLCEL